MDIKKIEFIYFFQTDGLGTKNTLIPLNYKIAYVAIKYIFYQFKSDFFLYSFTPHRGLTVDEGDISLVTVNLGSSNW